MRSTSASAFITVSAEKDSPPPTPYPPQSSMKVSRSAAQVERGVPSSSFIVVYETTTLLFSATSIIVLIWLLVNPSLERIRI